jgi:hypothetical protein
LLALAFFFGPSIGGSLGVVGLKLGEGISTELKTITVQGATILVEAPAGVLVWPQVDFARFSQEAHEKRETDEKDKGKKLVNHDYLRVGERSLLINFLSYFFLFVKKIRPAWRVGFY